MEPGVPFALLGSVQLLAVAAWTGVAVAGFATSRSRRLPVWLLLAGAAVLGAAEVATALSFGTAGSDRLALVRAAGALFVAAAVQQGALGGRARGDGGPGEAPLAGLVVPLGAGLTPGLGAAACSLLAAGATLRARRDPGGLLLTGGLVATAGTSLAGLAAATSPSAASAVLVLRALGSLAILAGLVVLLGSSLLAKVVAAILAGVLAMAGAAVGVVGTVVVQAYDRQAASLVEQAAQGRLQALDDLGNRAAALAPFVAGICTGPAVTPLCNAALDRLAPRTKDFVALVTDRGVVLSLGGRAPLSPAERLGLAAPRGPVQTVLGSSGSGAISSLPTRMALAGEPPGLAVVAVQVPSDARPVPQGRPTKVLVYGIRIDDDYTRDDFDAGGYGLSALAGDPLRVVASNLSDRERGRLQRIATQYGVDRALPPGGLTVAAVGQQPTVHFTPLLGVSDTPVGVLALSRDARTSLGAQHDALRVLLLTALATTAVVGGLAVLLGRRTVEPVRRLTAAAERVTAGDLTASAGVTSQDEVGTLSRAFDVMTGSLGRLTEDLRASATRLQTVLTSMSDGLLATDADALVTSINPAALAMVGLTDEGDAVGRPLAEVLDARDAAGAPLADLHTSRHDLPAEVHRPGQEPVPVRLSVAPLDSGAGVVVVLRDTTRERDVERMKTEFLSNVSHELRTPLTPIRGYADILVSRPGLATRQVTKFATTILDESLRMSRVVDLLVDVAALEAGRVTVAPRRVSAKELLDGRLAAWRERVPERAGDLRRRVAAGLPALHVDPVWVGKALDELIDNAVKHTPPGTPIVLGARPSPQDGRVRVSVRDSGPGIAEEHQPALFTSFEQVDGSATRRVGGLGLGLSFVRRLADDAGFPLSLHSQLGRGTEVSLDLPVTEDRAALRRR